MVVTVSISMVKGGDVIGISVAISVVNCIVTSVTVSAVVDGSVLASDVDIGWVVVSVELGVVETVSGVAGISVSESVVAESSVS